MKQKSRNKFPFFKLVLKTSRLKNDNDLKINLNNDENMGDGYIDKNTQH